MTRVKACEEITPARSSSIFAGFFPIPELQQTATAKDKRCTYISNKNRRCRLFSRWINPAAISNNKPFRSSPPKTSAAKKPLLLGGTGRQSQDSQFHAKGMKISQRNLTVQDVLSKTWRRFQKGTWHFQGCQTKSPCTRRCNTQIFLSPAPYPMLWEGKWKARLTG